MTRPLHRFIGIVAWLLVSGAPALAEDNPAIVETLSILRERGMIDEAKHAELLAKNQAWEASHPSLLSRLEWSGDFRGRLENLWYHRDAFTVGDSVTEDRSRARYRFRIGARAKINDVVTAGFRLASGDGDHRSSNESFGNEPDYGPDPIFLDQAYVELAAPKRFLPETMSVKTILGKQANPFLWKNGRDFMIWDNDITPEGIGFQVAGAPGESLSLFGNAGYFIADENGARKDPHVLGVQGGFAVRPMEQLELGARASLYDWGSVDDPFLTRAAENGSLITDVRDYQVGELAAYGRIGAFEAAPILVYAQIAQNLEADTIGGVGDEDLGWGAGVEIGDKKRNVMLGAGYYHLEANFSPSQFTDSDLFDGFTNRQGFMVYVAREIFANTELNLTFFNGEEIEDSAAFDIGTVTGETVPSADRYRLQTDVVVKF